MSERVSRADLVDLYTVAINKELPVDDKSIEFVRQIKTPYHYRVGDVKITAQFDSDAPKLTRRYTRLTA
jgi:myo-inositol-1-phosphate synthase